jgi:2'-5' RNA ligase
MATTSLSQMPGYRSAEYVLILNPHEDLRNRIMNVKKEFSDKHNASNAVGVKPYITLVRFNVWEMMEDKIVNSLKPIAMASPAFKVALKDYGSFPTHTIYIDVASKVPIQNLVRELRASRRLMKSPDHDPHFITEPYIPIARKLTHEQFAPAWEEYSRRHFTASFIADGMLLLKRREGEKGYQIVQRFEFQNLPVSIKQGELF